METAQLDGHIYMNPRHFANLQDQELLQLVENKNRNTLILAELPSLLFLHHIRAPRSMPSEILKVQELSFARMFRGDRL